MTVLAADDDPDARELVKRLLEPFGAKVTTTASAPEAFEAMRRLRPDVLVTDIAMPEEDGFSLLRRVRALAPEDGGSTPVIALTAHAAAGDDQRMRSAGFDRVVSKPVDPAELGAMIGMLADTKRRPEC